MGAKFLNLAADMNHYEHVSQHERVPETEFRAGELLAGHRGRELCAQLAGIALPKLHGQFVPRTACFFPMTDPGGESPLDLAESLSQHDEEGPAAEVDLDDQLAVIPALADVAEEANYWGRPGVASPEDPALIARLRCTAVRLAESVGCQWWWSGPDRAAQRYVQWTAREDPPRFGDAAEMLHRVDSEAADNERQMARDRHKAVGSGMSGAWWSHPFPGAISTTRRLGSLGAVLLAGP